MLLGAVFQQKEDKKMERNSSVTLSLLAAAILISLSLTGAAQTPNEANLARVIGGGSAVTWEVGVANSGGTLTVVFPDGRAVRKSVRAGAPLQISLGEKYFETLPDGIYVYEIQLAPAVSVGLKEALQKGRGKDDDPENERAARKRSTVSPLTQSGSFAVVNGSIILPGAVEPQQRHEPKTSRAIEPAASMNPFRRLLNHRSSFLPDVVTADDEIIQGSLCVGLDCVNNENFGFDTIRVKENNTRIQFDDTSTAAGFPTNNWQIRANSSVSGGENFLGIVDQGSTSNSETGTVVFQVNAGAPANSLRVANTGKIGLRTATPVLDVHMNTADTPAIRFEQNNTGAFTAQTWDVAGNEANFFVRDVTSGSRLPFRIRPGAPTSSIDISATGNVGVGTASPSGLLHLLSSSTNGTSMFFQNSDTGGRNWRFLSTGTTNTGGAGNFGLVNATDDPNNFKLIILSSGNVGIATASPTQTLSVNGTAGKPGGGTWDVFSDERLKNINGRYNTGLKALMQLQPLRYEYKRDNALGINLQGEQVGFGAQSVQRIIPEAVTKDSSGYLMVKTDPILWTMLNAIKEQQQQIVELRREVRRLRASRTRRR